MTGPYEFVMLGHCDFTPTAQIMTLNTYLHYLKVPTPMSVYTLPNKSATERSLNSKDDHCITNTEILRDPKELCATRGQSAAHWAVADL